MKTNKLSILFLALSLITACQTEPPHEPTMVLEGWIDANGYPIILLHKSFVMDNVPDSVQTIEEVAKEQIILWGRVAISDGEKEVVLTGRLDTNYMPPYCYTTLNMKGEVGKSYTVTATFKNMKATATTTIPPICSMDSAKIGTPADEKKKNLYIYMSNLPDEPAYYALFMRRKGEKQYQFCPYGVFHNSKATDNKLEVMVFSPFRDSIGTVAGLFPLFMKDTVNTYQMKVSRIDEESYRFWSEYSSMISSQGVFFVPVFQNIHGNVSGGIGNFTGMGSSAYEFKLSVDTTYVF